MVQNITGAVATNATETTLTISYDINLTTIISIISVIIILVGFLYKYGQQLGELKGTKELIDAKLKFIDEKYNTSEKIQNIELTVKDKINRDELNTRDKISRDNLNTHIYEIVNQLLAMSEEIKTLKKQNEDLKKELEQHKNLHSRRGKIFE